MKKQLLLLAFCVMTHFTYAQNVNIPDSSFKAYLISDTLINTNKDGEIQVVEAEAYSGKIKCNGKQIVDMKGIEAFKNITELYCYANKINSLNVASNTKLEILDCYINQITSLYLLRNDKLKRISCHNNKLTELNVSSNTNLSRLSCGSNKITSLNLTKNDSIEYLSIGGNSFTAIYLGNLKKLKWLYLSWSNINGLNVLANTNLNTLHCDKCELDVINLSKNLNLESLSLYGNNLTSLDLSKNMKLKKVVCDANDISTLKIAHLASLEKLGVGQTKLTSLDISNNRLLTELICSENKLDSLNVANGNNRNFTEFYAADNPNLSCIQVDSKSYSDSNWMYKDSIASYSENCGGPTANVKKLLTNEIVIYPNPTKGIVKFTSRLTLSKISVYSLQGKLLQTSINASSIDIANQSNGLYLIKIDTPHGTRQQRILKQ